MRSSVLLLQLIAAAAAALKTDDATTGYSSAITPFYRDPLFDGAHDAELVWHEGEQSWWITYLQNRYNSCARSGPMLGPTTGTDLGLASSPDGGKTWIYRGVMRGLDVPTNDMREAFPPGARTAQYGGATWWRPAVTTVNGIYHGFFSYWEQPIDWGFWKVVHYTSTDMVRWKFEQFIRNSTCPPHASPTATDCTVAYDSAVFRVSDGRYVLFSAGPSPGFTGPHPPLLCTKDAHLLQWEKCEESLQLYDQLESLRASVGAEGAHVIDRNASVTYEGYSWMNWEGRGPICDHTTHECMPGTPNLARSSDGGMHWEASTTNLWGSEYGSREFDAGQVAFQGPLLLQGSELFALYFTEFNINNGTKPANNLPGCTTRARCDGVSDHCSMVQLARVRLNSTSGWLEANRSEPFSVTLQPPPNAAAPPRVLPKVLTVAKAEAAAIAAAEMDRWMDLSRPSGRLSMGILHGFKLAEEFYAAQQEPSASACVAACDADANCSAVTFCELGARWCSCPTSHADEGTPGGCCFRMTHAVDVGAGGHARGACRAGAKSNCGPPASAACRGWSSASKLGLWTQTSEYPGDEYQRWRNPAFSESFFDSITREGAGSSTVWRLSSTRNDTCGHCSARSQKFEMKVVANGTIAQLSVNGERLVPLQWRKRER
eukprot:SAG31_NODE_2060_length_6538_cov_10.244448_3_plen_659_part_00